MKNLKTILVAVLATFSIAYVNAQDLQLGVGLKGSTMGFGGDAILRFHPKMDVRVGVEKLGYNRSFTFEESDIKYRADAGISLGSVSALFDYYVASSFFVTAGFGYNMFHIDIDGTADSDLEYGDITIPKEKIGDFEFDIDPGMKISPYLGIGFGKTLGVEKNISFAFEMGTFIQGSPDLSIHSTGLISPTMNPEQGQEAILEGQISQYNAWPVIKFNVAYKIFSF